MTCVPPRIHGVGSGSTTSILKILVGYIPHFSHQIYKRRKFKVYFEHRFFRGENVERMHVRIFNSLIPNCIAK